MNSSSNHESSQIQIWVNRLVHKSVSSLIVVIATLLAPALLLAADPVTAIQVGSDRHSGSGQSDNFDVVVQYGVTAPGKLTNLDLYLSDYETNAPLAGATIQVSVSGDESVTASATAEDNPGLYNVSLTFPKKGSFDLLFDITTADKSDIVEVKGIEVGVSEAPQVKNEKNLTWVYIATSGVSILFIIVGLGRRGRKSTKNIAAGIMILVLLSFSSHPAYAHGGVDDEPAGVTAAAGAPGYMSKASQFLLGVRTVLAKTQLVSKQITALGRVVAPPTSQVQVRAPQSGILVSSTEVSYPNQGDWVKKGQAIAVLQVLDQFIIRAPISGIVQATHAVPGVQVDQSTELFTIFDNSKVWVEANLFESDLAGLESKPAATIAVDRLSGKSLPTRFVNFDNVVDPATRTLRAIYEVDNSRATLRPGMAVNVNIESEKRLEALVVPANSIMDWEGQKVVFVHERPEIFEMRSLKILGYYGDLVAVEGSLVSGDRIVTSGAYELLSIPHRLAEGRSK